MNTASALKPLTLFLLGLTISMSPVASADTDSDGDGVVDSIDVDDDNDGLIELHSLAELNMMRFNTNGSSLKPDADTDGSSEGCSYINDLGDVNEWCFGYELVADVDFDTNGNGEIDQGDEFCNYSEERGVCEGWDPIGHLFQAVFNGNGHTIRNLYIDHPGAPYTGFFYRTNYRTLSDVIFTGPLTSVTGGGFTGIVAGDLGDRAVVSGVVVEGTVIGTGDSSGFSTVGGIAGVLHSATVKDSIVSVEIIGQSFDNGYSTVGGIAGTIWSDSVIENTVITGTVDGYNAGGVIGYFRDFGIIRNTVSAASVTGINTAGGMVGVMVYDTTIENSLALGAVNGTAAETEAGGLVGAFSLDVWLSPFTLVELPHNYWATDTTGQSQLFGIDLTLYDRAQIRVVSSSYGATLDQLECPTHASAAYCLLRTRLYLNWDESLWDFGSSDDLPGLIINGTVYRPIQTMDDSFDIIEG